MRPLKPARLADRRGAVWTEILANDDGAAIAI
jgi:hypothetical protein